MHPINNDTESDADTAENEQNVETNLYLRDALMMNLGIDRNEPFTRSVLMLHNDRTLRSIAEKLEKTYKYSYPQKHPRFPYFVRIWIKFKHMKYILPLNEAKYGQASITIDQIDAYEANNKCDCERWTEIPDDFVRVSIRDLDAIISKNNQNEVMELGIEKFDPLKKIWPFQERMKMETEISSFSNSEWRKALKIGDIVDARDIVGNWCEGVIRYIDGVNPKRFHIHYIGKHRHYDDVLPSNDDNISKRNTQTDGPYRNKSRSVSEKYPALRQFRK